MEEKKERKQFLWCKVQVHMLSFSASWFPPPPWTGVGNGITVRKDVKLALQNGHWSFDDDRERQNTGFLERTPLSQTCIQMCMCMQTGTVGGWVVYHFTTDRPVRRVLEMHRLIGEVEIKRERIRMRERKSDRVNDWRILKSRHHPTPSSAVVFISKGYRKQCRKVSFFVPACAGKWSKAPRGKRKLFWTIANWPLWMLCIWWRDLYLSIRNPVLFAIERKPAISNLQNRYSSNSKY